MNIRTPALAAALLLEACAPSLACTAQELGQKMQKFGETTKAAFERDPDGDAARQARVQDITARYAPQAQKAGAGAIDVLCREYDELLAVYK